MKKLAIFLVALAAIGFAFGILKDMFLKAAIEKGAGRLTGMQLSMGSFKAGVVNPVIHVRDLTLSNPAGFSETVMIDMPEIYIAYDLPALTKGKLHVKDARFEINEFTVERSASGAMNVDRLTKTLSRKARERTPGSAAAPAPAVVIDRLRLKIGKVVFRDLSKPSAGVREFPINIDEEFTGITDLKMLADILVSRALLASGVYKLAGIDPAELRSAAAQIAAMGMDAAAQQASAIAARASDGSASRTVRQAAGIMQDALKELGSAGGDK